MSIDNIIIPSGILEAWKGAQNTGNQGGDDALETFDITEVARQRAKSLSVSITRPVFTRTNRSRYLNSINHSKQRSQSTGLQPLGESRLENVLGHQPLRASSINLGGLGRSRVTGRNTPANPGLRLDRTSSIFETAGKGAVQVRPSLGTTSELQNTYVFQSLDTSRRTDGATNTIPRDTSVFLGRNTSSASARSRRRFSEGTHVSASGIIRRASILFESAAEKVKDVVNGTLRRSSLEEVYEKAKIRQMHLKRSNIAQISFQYSFYLIILAVIYFVFIGVPFWNGLVLTIYYIFDMKLVVPAGTAAFLGTGFLYAYLPLLMTFEKAPEERNTDRGHVEDTALLIPCYKSEKLIAATLEAALKVFPARNIFVIANGNSPTPLDNTAIVCESYGVSHTWSPIGSKIVAQYVGCYVTKRFPYVLLIDDDCLLPPNFPIVTDRFSSRVNCIGYTIKSVGPNSSKGTLCQQAQDVEYKISGIQRAFAGKIGSATFPHGAISIWDRQMLIKTFQAHPGFSVSEDWFFGHVARQLGCRIQMCTSVFVETETPSSIFFSGGGARGGFGEMTIWKQRFFRWNFFFISGIYYDLAYILCDWSLGWWELGAKIFVFQEVYETLLYLLAPFVLPISFYVRPSFSGYLYAATLALYMVNVVIFNYYHLRTRGESVSVACLLYYLPYKVILTFVNIASCYYSIYKYAKYFAKRHPKVIEDEEAVAVVLRLEEESISGSEKASIEAGHGSLGGASFRARRFSITAVGTNLSSITQEPPLGTASQKVDVLDFATGALPILDSVPEGEVCAPTLPWTAKIGRMPPDIPSHSRPFSWHRSTSNKSSESNVSPFDEGDKLQFPLPPTTSSMAQESSSQNPTTVPGHFALVSTMHHPTYLHGKSSAGTKPLTRWPTGAPGLALDRSSRPSSSTGLQSMLHRYSSHMSRPTYSENAPIIESPQPLELNRPRQRFISRATDAGIAWPLPSLQQPDASRYICALADTGNDGWYERRADHRGRIFIVEEDSEEEAEENVLYDSDW